MKKYSVVFLIILTIGLVIFFTKPFIRDYEVVFNESTLKVRDNLLSGEVKVFDSNKLAWVSVSDYKKTLIYMIDLKFEALKIEDYSTIQEVINRELSQYDFITPDDINSLNKQTILASDIPSRKKLISSFNELIEEYKLIEIEKINLEENF
ncbi:hypothetical protein [Fusibacter tunisiensis]|uniref:DUF4230 domain-containing protein n=1 Tax=Fusibacter tunisiensis TaxID=1008308 RepID=A0ABS2MTJ4_9FIRM|nr:hypothetical protein [Fusibacter tunisiensis]MBM7562724.1 hypothetical protein [Fusibacter tunisiensis]